MMLLNQIVFPYYFKLFDEEEKKEVIERVLGNMRELTEDYGPGVYIDQMEKTVKYIILFLQKKTFCQDGHGDIDEDLLEKVENDSEGEEEEDLDEDDGIDHDEIILGNVTDLVISLARSFGNDFAPAFAQLASHIVEYTTDKHPKSDKNMALGCIAEVFAAADSVIPNYFDHYLQLL